MIIVDKEFINSYNPECVIHVVMDVLWDGNIQHYIFRLKSNGAVIHWGYTKNYIIGQYHAYIKYLNSKGYLSKSFRKFLESIKNSPLLNKEE